MSQSQNRITGGNRFPKPMISGKAASVNGLPFLHLKIAIRQRSIMLVDVPSRRNVRQLLLTLLFQNENLGLSAQQPAPALKTSEIRC